MSATHTVTGETRVISIDAFNEMVAIAQQEGYKKEIIRLGQALAKRDQKIEKLYKRIKGLRQALRQSQVAIKHRNQITKDMIDRLYYKVPPVGGEITTTAAVGYHYDYDSVVGGSASPIYHATQPEPSKS